MSARKRPDGAPNSLDIALGVRIRLRREELGLTQVELANMVQLTPPQLWKYEHGLNQVGFSRLIDIAHALGCRVVDLADELDDADDATPRVPKDIPYLRTAGAVELLEAYCEVPHAVQWLIVKLLEAMA